LTPETFGTEPIHSFDTQGNTNSETLLSIPEELILHIVYDNLEETALHYFQGDKELKESRRRKLPVVSQ
jgi:hypothetical protein